MPLYTYVSTYKGQSHISQSRRSNPKGFPDWAEVLPQEIRAKLNPYDGAFESVPNRLNVWRKTLTIDGSELVVFAIQTDG